MKVLVATLALALTAIGMVSASPLAMWVSGDLPAAAEAETWMVDAAASSPLPPPKPLLKSGAPPAKAKAAAPVGSGESKVGSHHSQGQPDVSKPLLEKRVGCSVAYNDATYTFGGADKTHGALTADISRFDQMQRTWELVRRSRNTSPAAAEGPAGASNAAAAEPCPRYGHSCSVAGSRLVMYGGFTEHDEALADLWQYNFLDNAWQQLSSPEPSAAAAAAAQPAPKPGAPAPPPPPAKAPVYADLAAPASEYNVHVVTPGGRGGHVSVVDNAGQRLWVFGGRNSRGEVLNDLFSYDLVTVQHGGVWTAHMPPREATHVAVGANAPAVYPRTTDRVVSAAPYDNAVVWPGAREQHSCIVDRDDVMWCYGGVGYAADPKYFGTLSDVWSFPLSAAAVGAVGTAAWSCEGGSVHHAVNERPRYVLPEYVHHFENLPPQKRDPKYYRFQQKSLDATAEDASLLAVDASVTLSTAGKSRARAAQRASSRVRILPVGPGGRYSPLMTYDASKHAVWMFGGRDASHTAMNDLWALELANRRANWINYHGLSTAKPPAQRSVSGPMVWPPSYGGAYTYASAALVPHSDNGQMYVFGSRPFAANNDVWLLDLYGRGAMSHGVDVCASNPCAHGGSCRHLPDALLGGGVGYECRCTIGYNGRHCEIGNHLFRHINNPFVGGHPLPVPDFGDWKPIEDLTKPYPIVEAYVPPKVKAAPPPIPVTVGPGYIPNTETRTVQLWRDPYAPARELPVELAPNLNSDPRVIREAEKTLKSTTKSIDVRNSPPDPSPRFICTHIALALLQTLHHKIRRISNAPLVEHPSPYGAHSIPDPQPAPVPGPAAPPTAPAAPAAVAPAAAAPAAPGVLQPMAAPPVKAN